LCVTWMIVVPSWLSFWNKSMMASPCVECRLPVGSSAKTSFGLAIQGLPVLGFQRVHRLAVEVVFAFIVVV